eukprot:CAMPEP_0195271346 /NCGR_PEP_ID=MMETSP0706-20130129/15008_1 /TAXON_ID=33640 /ORGANISM="Asterionellopsis glacialis, Strain CCMP134" /LENGTH=314 /DNA_ID=CAMNT_0040327025 /DNA_START=19 /DNA_END=963 /DNA_ORIENTATION=+
MRRLTNKDSAARKKLEDEAAPDFYALSRSHPLPENTPIPSPAIPASMAPPGVTGGSFVDMEAALMERRRAALVDRMNLLASTGQMPKDMMLASTVQMPKDVNIMPAAPSGLGFSGAPGPSSNHCFQQLVGKGNTGSQDMAQLFAMDGNNRGIFVPCMANGMTDGMVTGMTNGVANGMANGVANGMATGMAPGMANGVANGMANGVANGMANGVANGMANGVTNGMANGVANGMANGVTNGMANGVANGMANGVTNGMANGVANGMATGMAPSMATGLAPGMAESMADGMATGVATGMTTQEMGSIMGGGTPFVL